MDQVRSSLGDFFTQSTIWVKKNPTQPNPHGLGWVGLNPWIGQFFYLFIYYYYYYKLSKYIYIYISLAT